MLKLRRGRVVSVERTQQPARVARLAVALEQGDAPRPAIAYPELTGPVEHGDEVIVNVEARDLGLGSGGFDILYANLTRGPAVGGEQGHVMKLNYTPMQHAVRPVEEGLEQVATDLTMPVAVLALHGQLACAAFALMRRARGLRVGYVQTAGGALPGWQSDVVAALVEREMISDHITAAPCFGGGQEAVTVEGALHAGAKRLRWDTAFLGPGPGILGSASALGHGGLAALQNAHAACSLGCHVVLAPRVSSSDERERHRGLSHHTRVVLSLLLRSVDVAVSAGVSSEVRTALERSIAAGLRHRVVEMEIDDLVPSYLESGLPASTMGRSFDEDPDFFKSGLAAGALLAEKVGGGAA